MVEKQFKNVYSYCSYCTLFCIHNFQNIYFRKPSVDMNRFLTMKGPCDTFYITICHIYTKVLQFKSYYVILNIIFR